MKHGILQTHASLITFFSQLIDLFIIPLFLYGSVYFMGSELLPLSLVVGALIATMFFQFMASVRGLYLSMRGESIETEFFKCFKYWTVAFLLAAVVMSAFIKDGNSISFAFLTWYVSVVVYFLLSRVSMRGFLRYIRRKGYNQRNIVIVGAGDVGIKLADNIYQSSELGLKVVGFYDDEAQGLIETKQQGLEVAGNLNDLLNDAKLMNFDRIYITLSMRHMPYIKDMVEALADTTCSVVFVPDMFAFDLLNSRMGHLNGIPTISIYDTPMEGANRLVKRIEDMVLSAIILTLISPILLIIAIAIKVTSPGPVLFKQNRYGIDGKPINVWKFRSMTVADNGDKIVQATKGDARITPLGAFLRKTSLDELPQFINSFNGEMSIVGPRPHAVAHNEEYRKLIGGYMLRHKVKPGITGWAQINGWRGETDTLDKMEKRIEFDLEYISNWSLVWDLKIIFLTIFKGFVNKNAY
ncbi:undecaprenyl-phosphate glucose phosphotransferase [Thalassotalea psychrophila]|uniref:Undecaprenyl-phosphate glucose phosphotransferase n=1 Tax=Thalassotalea psychrophila TaxID=3065647 RepID=A0ABY9TRJ4_9GAMM|nr:undecaprenyl-phosphate glucose phosphotransferase [Colwelliaceae bacterium SQ149]